jgi:hypothetical protein
MKLVPIDDGRLNCAFQSIYQSRLVIYIAVSSLLCMVIISIFLGILLGHLVNNGQSLVYFSGEHVRIQYMACENAQTGLHPHLDWRHIRCEQPIVLEELCEIPPWQHT